MNAYHITQLQEHTQEWYKIIMRVGMEWRFCLEWGSTKSDSLSHIDMEKAGLRVKCK